MNIDETVLIAFCVMEITDKELFASLESIAAGLKSSYTEAFVFVFFDSVQRRRLRGFTFKQQHTQTHHQY